MNILIIGANQGIGAAIAKQLNVEGNHTVIKTSRQYATLTQVDEMTWEVAVDVTDENSISEFSKQLRDGFSVIDWVINCAGLLHSKRFMPEKSLDQVNQLQMLQSFMTNAVGHLWIINALKKMIIQSKLPLVCSVSARIGSITDNHLGGWYAYRMSKAALNMGIKNVAIEWSRLHPKVKFILIHPGTSDTDLSKPFQKRLPKGQLQTTDTTAKQLLKQLNQHQNHPEKHPLYIDYQGRVIAW